MKSMFDKIDDWLEDKYGGIFQLHPKRPRRGKTSNKEADGLFNIGADFSLGYGSELGRGYVVQIEMATLEHIPRETRRQIENDVERLVRERLPQVFPGQSLTLERDGNLLKIIGDFNLGSVIVK
ncbi:hypothetical protein S1OALGB6SA_2109 [Olavius algarvensis spirochete endosymbiont]|uniref:hypothetical protein n=1 Tax=Olavius algarvensis spirochete endosymbiont TaxID=260710 RepID=UPI000F1E6CCC|nr:hypothetical protein [Olavius algarvensis spirochete endosymbiont]VDB01015.1 hypothetical protein S1OALGB6SA_2109 [Olavius algarvensis spirochete endosymbiont]